MKKLLAALIASAFATVAFAQDKMATKDEKKKAEATKPYGNSPTENKAPAAAAKDAPAKKDAMTPANGAAPKKDATPPAATPPAATKDTTKKSDKATGEMKSDVKKP